jgi:hypothetical protein
MFTRKQLWRRAQRNVKPMKSADDYSPFVITASVSSSAIKTTSTPRRSIDNSDIPAYSPINIAKKLIVNYSPFLAAVTCKNNTTRQLRFSNTVNVILIPTRSELRSHGCDLYWTCEEVGEFRNDAIVDLHAYAQLKSIPLEVARRELYFVEAREPESCLLSFSLRTRKDSVDLGSCHSLSSAGTGSPVECRRKQPMSEPCKDQIWKPNQRCLDS